MSGANDKAYQKAQEAIDAINTASNITRTLFISLMSLSAYLAVVIASTNDLDLLLYSPIKLPILTIEIDLKGFYTWTPWLYLIVHAYTLLNLSLLSDKLDYFDNCCQDLEYPQRLHLRKQLHVHSFTQHIGARNEGIIKLALNLLNWLTMAILPLGILLFLLLDFLPAQEVSIVWGQRWALLIDSLLCLTFWNSILRKRRKTLLPKGWKIPLWRRWTHGGATLIIFAIFVNYLAFFVALIPLTKWERTLHQGKIYDPKQISWGDVIYEGKDDSIVYCKKFTPTSENKKSDLRSDQNTRYCKNDRHNNSIHELLVNDWTDQIIQAIKNRSTSESCLSWKILKPSCSTWFLFDRDQTWLGLHRSLTIKGEIITANQLNAETQNKLIQLRDRSRFKRLSKEYFEDLNLFVNAVNPVNLSKRWLRFANFKNSALPKVIIDGTQLQGAQLDRSFLFKANGKHTQLQKAELYGARLNGAYFRNSIFQESDLATAELRNSDLLYSQFQGADLSSSNLNSANLSSSEFQGAMLSNVQFENADLSNVQFQATDLTGANFQSSILMDSELLGSDLLNAEFQGAILNGTNLQGTNLTEAQFQGSEIGFANFLGADLTNTNFIATDLYKVQFQGAIVDQAQIDMAYLTEITTWQADEKAELIEELQHLAQHKINEDYRERIKLSVTRIKNSSSKAKGSPSKPNNYNCLYETANQESNPKSPPNPWSSTCVIANENNISIHAPYWAKFMSELMCNNENIMERILLRAFAAVTHKGLLELSKELSSIAHDYKSSCSSKKLLLDTINKEPLPTVPNEHLENVLSYKLAENTYTKLSDVASYLYHKSKDDLNN